MAVKIVKITVDICKNHENCGKSRHQFTHQNV